MPAGAELDYALATNRTVLPVAVGEPVPDAVLPRSLSRLQRIDAADPMRLARALVNLPVPEPLPDPLPEPPPVPISYMDELARCWRSPSSVSPSSGTCWAPSASAWPRRRTSPRS